MFEVMLVESNQRVVDLIGAMLYREFNAVVTDIDNAREAVNSVENKNSYDLIIMRDCLAGEQTASYITNVLEQRKIDIPKIVVGNLYTNPSVINIESHFQTQDLINLIIRILKISKDQLEAIKIPEYVAVPTYYFTMMSSTPCDAYICIKKNNEPDQYIKRIHQGDSIEQNKIATYQESGLNVFYIESKNRFSFMDMMVAHATKVMDEKIDANDDDQMVSTLSDSFNISQDLIRDLGIDEHAVKMVANNLKGIVSGFSASSGLGSLIRALLNSPGSYAYRHSHMISLMSYKVIPVMDWWPKNQIKVNLKKMIFVSFFHDILLLRDDLVRLATKNDLVLANLDKKEKELVENHANQISTTVLSYPRAPAGVDVILRQHHGVSNGIGLPRSYSSSISSMAIMFIVLEEFVDRLLNFQAERLTIPQILNNLEDKFTQPAYRRCVKAIRECLKKGI